MDFEEFTSACWTWAKDTVEELGVDFAPTFTGLDTQGRLHVLSMSKYGDAKFKPVLRKLLSGYCACHRITMYAVSSSGWSLMKRRTTMTIPEMEQWVKENGRPSESPERIDSLVVFARSKDSLSFESGKVTKQATGATVSSFEECPKLISREDDSDFQERLNGSAFFRMFDFEYLPEQMADQNRDWPEGTVWMQFFDQIYVTEKDPARN